jgi:deoxycytidine triphosphate deaminase
MFIKPTVAIDNGWIKGDFTDENIQPNALDFSLDKLFTIDHTKVFRISEESKEMKGGQEVGPEIDSKTGQEYWRLNGHTSYDGMSDFYVDIPDGVAAMLIIRSTFNRNGIFITSGLYDSGFRGHCGFAIHNNSTYAYVAPNTRIGQIIFVESESAKMYSGGYNHKSGSHYSEK